MRSAVAFFILLVLVLGAVPARADPTGAVHDPDVGRVGVLPQSWVETLERNHISEQTALIVGGTSAVAIGVGVYAGVGAATGATGATLAAVWLAHLPFHFALWGGAGYVGWNYLWPAPVEPAPGDTVAISLSSPAD
ncbi:MAG: hypothetical protein NXI19_08960 [Alphaproteobacteria bacterium]|nr:hypothetical protein [Alphaproteobacteria bacterium]